jgi:hypothetical protein
MEFYVRVQRFLFSSESVSAVVVIQPLNHVVSHPVPLGIKQPFREANN